MRHWLHGLMHRTIRHDSNVHSASRVVVLALGIVQIQ
jgi:hypothetical protein